MPAGGWASRRRARRSISRSSRARCRRPVPAPPAPSSVAATAGVRMGMRAARKVPIHDCRAALAGGRRTIFECAVSGNLGERPLHRDGAAQPCACTPVAQLRRGITSGWPRSAGSGCHNALRAAGCPGGRFRRQRALRLIKARQNWWLPAACSEKGSGDRSVRQHHPSPTAQ